MKKSFVLLSVFVLSVFTMSAQQPKSFESVANIDKKTTGNAVSIEVAADIKSAQSVMVDLLKSSGLKGKSGKVLTYEKVAFPEISTDYLNIYVSFEAKVKNKNNPITKVNVFVQKGISTTYENSNSDLTLINNLKTFLDTKYVKAINNNNVENSIDLLKKDLDKKQKELEKRKKDVTGYEKDIKTAEDNIKKANSDIDKLTKEVDALSRSIQQQNNSLQK